MPRCPVLRAFLRVGLRLIRCDRRSPPPGQDSRSHQTVKIARAIFEFPHPCRPSVDKPVSLGREGWVGFFDVYPGDDIRGAEHEKAQTIRAAGQARELAGSIAAASGKAVAPRLTVLTVDEGVWRETVAAFAERADAVLIDVSDVTDNVLWEIRNLDQLAELHPVFVARHDAVNDPRLAVVLGARTVLVYTTTLLGRRRFERALFGQLEGTRPPLTLTRRQFRSGMCLSLGLACFGWSLWAGVEMITSRG